jgi:hypothetical protein
LALLLSAVLAATLPGPAATAASSACGPGMTALGGELRGHPYGEALNATVNVEFTDSATQRAYDVYTDGRVDTAGHPAGTRYSYTDNVNAQFERGKPLPPGVVLDKTWGAPGKPGVLCFTTNPRITQAYIEVYPRRPVDDDGDGTPDRTMTDRSKYGGAAHYRQPARAGADNTGIVLRLPSNIPSAVGFLHGFISYRGKAARSPATPTARTAASRASAPAATAWTPPRAAARRRTTGSTRWPAAGAGPRRSPTTRASPA